MDRSGANVLPPHVWKRIAFYRRTLRLAHHLEDHPGEPLTLEQASAIACMERTAFSRFFKQHIGLKFSEFLRTYRVQLAIREMLNQNSSLKEIARTVGFNCVATFERQFKKETGVCPSRFRARRLRRSGVLLLSPGGAGQPQDKKPTSVC